MKQYLMMCDDVGLNALKAVSNGLIHFLPVEGLTTGEEGKYDILVTPKYPQESKTEISN